MTPEQLEEARNEADNHADTPVGELLDLALAEIERLLKQLKIWQVEAFGREPVRKLFDERNALREEVAQLKDALPKCHVCLKPLLPGEAELGNHLTGTRLHAGCETGLR